MAKKVVRYQRKAVGVEGFTANDLQELQSQLADVGVRWTDKKTARSVTWTFGELNPLHVAKACAYGLAKLGEDRTSAADEDVKLAARQELATFFKGEKWAKPRAGGFFTVSPEIEAVAAVKGVGIAAIQAMFRKANKTEDGRAKLDLLLEQPEIAAKIEAIKADRAEIEAEGEVDLDDLL